MQTPMVPSLVVAAVDQVLSVREPLDAPVRGLKYRRYSRRGFHNNRKKRRPSLFRPKAVISHYNLITACILITILFRAIHKEERELEDGGKREDEGVPSKFTKANQCIDVATAAENGFVKPTRS